MNRNYHIKNPCDKNWDDLKPVKDGRFCETCNKTVWDLSSKSNDEVKSLQKKGKICGYLPKKNNINHFSALLLSVSLLSCNTLHHSKSKIFKFKGKITEHTSVNLKDFEVQLITKSKIYPGKITENKNFEIEIPSSEIKSENILRLAFYSDKKDADSSVYHIITKEFINKMQIFDVDNYGLIGGARIYTSTPPNFYYIDGKSVSKRKFNKTKDENTNLEYVSLNNIYLREAVAREAANEVHLLYTKSNDKK